MPLKRLRLPGVTDRRIVVNAIKLELRSNEPDEVVLHVALLDEGKLFFSSFFDWLQSKVEIQPAAEIEISRGLKASKSAVQLLD